MLEKTDNLNYEEDETIKEIIGEEEIYFSDTVHKIHQGIFTSNQERNLIITDQAIYNLKSKLLKRRIEIKNIKGITISKASDHFIVHGNQKEYDYLLISEKRFKIISLLEKLYEKLTQKMLLFSIKNEKDLSKFVVGKKDRKKNPSLYKIDPKDFMSIQEFLDSEGSLEITTHPNTYKLEIEFNKNKKYRPDESLANFELISLIGKGNTANLYLANYQGKENVVMKVFDKTYLYENDLIDKVLLEKNILCAFSKEKFLCHMKFFFMTTYKIIFVLPFYQGGDMYTLLEKNGPLDESLVASYIVQISHMISFLHTNNIVYRDLKLENLMIDDKGYLIMIDFGSCKVIEDKEELESSFEGSVDYLSPEVVEGEGHGLMTDWWSLGVLTYELIYGIPPFHSENTERVLELITGSEVSFNSKIKISSNCKDFIKKLLKKNPKERFGQNEFKQITGHGFFKGIPVNEIVSQKAKANIVPELSDDVLDNFDGVYINQGFEDFEQTYNQEVIDECEVLFEDFKG